MCQTPFHRELRNPLYLSVLVLLLLSSCQSIRQFVPPLLEEYIVRMPRSSVSGYKNVKRVRQYEFAYHDVPTAFDGCRLVFISDLYYRGLLKKEGLEDIIRLPNDLYPDAPLIGGGLHEGCEHVPDVIAALGAVKTPLDTYIVLRNNDYETYYDDILKEMERQGIHLLEHKTDTLKWNGEHIVIAGVRNPFDIGQNGRSPTSPLAPEDFVVLLTCAPDYAEDVPIINTDSTFVGHTHGGQVTVSGLYVPIIPSHYGQRFLTRLKYNPSNMPTIIANGIGTSNKNARPFAPSEVAAITLFSHP